MELHRSGVGPDRLLPGSVEERLRGLTRKAAGAGLLAIAAAGWLALLSWSAHDPSLTHATAGATRNWLGVPGAAISDLLLQSLGIAALLAFLPPVFWGCELIGRERLAAWKLRIGLAPFSVLGLAGAAAAVPTFQAWPLNHGLGGILGDVGYGLLTHFLATFNADRAGSAAGLLLLGVGLFSLFASLGLSHRELALIWQSEPDGEGRMSRLLNAARGSFARSPAPAMARGDGGFATRTLQPAVNRSPVPAWHATEDAGHASEPADSFDWHTDAESLAMAQRFAPKSAQAIPQAPPGRPAFSAPAAQPPTTHPEAAPAQHGPLGGFRAAAPERTYKRPSINLLKRPQAPRSSPEFTQSVLRGHARLLEDVLTDFGIKGEIKDIRPGPVVTVYELEPQRGTKAARVIALADDIARSMSVNGARIAGVAGRSTIGIELPNVRREAVHLREILESDGYRAGAAQLPIALGKTIAGEPVVADLAQMPHLLVAGTTGSGKSVGINAMILSLLYRHGPEACRLILIDPKMLELSVYNGVPHLLCPVITDPDKSIAALNWVVAEMEERYKRMSLLAVRNLAVYNNRVRHAAKRGERLVRTVQTGFDPRTGQAIYEKEPLDLLVMPHIVVVVDELADLMMVAGKQIEGAVQRLAQMARAAGIHLILATQRPSVDIVTGTIKASLPTRISFKVASKIDSRTILGEPGADQLLGQGDMLYSNGGGQLLRIHAPFVSDEEVEQVVEHLRSLGPPSYVGGITDGTFSAAGPGSAAVGEADDELYDRAVAIVVRERKASSSYLQRRLQIGYNRAAGMIERMEREGLLGPANNVGKRHILADEAFREGTDAA